MTDARALAEEAVLHLDRLGAVLLDDLGEGPPADELIDRARAARDVVARVGVAALSEVTVLIAGVANSLKAGATDWSPALGGTLMAAVDDLRALVGGAAQFSPEDSEHLHHRATELGAYVSERHRDLPPAAEAPALEAPRTPVAQGASPEPAAIVSPGMT